MRRLVGWIGGAVGGVTAYRLLRRRPQAAPETVPAEQDARADELRVKLAESRAAEPAVEEAPGEQPETEAAEPEVAELEPESPEERRRRVHEEGRAALDDMRPE